jgi:hypothetical protein
MQQQSMKTILWIFILQCLVFSNHALKVHARNTLQPIDSMNRNKVARLTTVAAASTKVADAPSSSGNVLHLTRFCNSPRDDVSYSYVLAEYRGAWPSGDSLDKRIMAIALPAMLNLAIMPLVGAADTFWVGRMANAQALAGQGAANQIFSRSTVTTLPEELSQLNQDFTPIKVLSGSYPFYPP